MEVGWVLAIIAGNTAATSLIIGLINLFLSRRRNGPDYVRLALAEQQLEGLHELVLTIERQNYNQEKMLNKLQINHATLFQQLEDIKRRLP